MSEKTARAGRRKRARAEERDEGKQRQRRRKTTERGTDKQNNGETDNTDRDNTDRDNTDRDNTDRGNTGRDSGDKQRQEDNIRAELSTRPGSAHEPTRAPDPRQLHPTPLSHPPKPHTLKTRREQAAAATAHTPNNPQAL